MPRAVVHPVVRFAACLAFALALLAGHPLAAAAPVAAQPKGSLVIIGGALRADNSTVWERMVQLAGGKGARIAVFASASASPEKTGKFLVDRFNQYGAKAFFVPVAVRLSGIDYQAAADDPALAAAVRSAGGAFFAGGDQGRITRALRRADGSNTRMLDALWDMYRRGGMLAGSSAGAAIMSSTMFGHPKPVLATMKLGLDEGKEIAPGLGFIGDDVFIDQHLLVRGRFARMVPAMLKKGYKIGLGIDENTAMVVGPNREVEVIGYRGALLVDLSKAEPRDGPLNISNVRLSYLDNGDRFNLQTQTFTPAPDKAENRVDPARPYYREPLFSADILGNSTVVDLMAKLIDSDQPEAIGLSLDSPNGVQPDLGFEFKLTRTGDSVGYQSIFTEQYSVYNMRLDIRPIVVQRPLYQYRQVESVAGGSGGAGRIDAAN
ncbi:cyanophycinase [Massilia sp. IC2-477]|uniref:cyanophycinase n=1 Tax=Massilia sp. IC2-477 TaxID=2887198 RepID=UPI001D1269C1|nr:cyanophycinase [Massilia sp. IC2-477]MCC2956772.1 cyanophycinase [Massilia sp. IC2-477]